MQGPPTDDKTMLGCQALQCGPLWTGWLSTATARRGTWMLMLFSRPAQLNSSASPLSGGRLLCHSSSVSPFPIPLLLLHMRRSLLAQGAKNYPWKSCFLTPRLPSSRTSPMVKLTLKQIRNIHLWSKEARKWRCTAVPIVGYWDTGTAKVCSKRDTRQQKGRLSTVSLKPGLGKNLRALTCL